LALAKTNTAHTFPHSHSSADAALIGSTLVYVPRIPTDTNEAAAMLKMTTLLADLTDPTDPEGSIRTYAGYTDDELRRGKPVVMVVTVG
jgi:hypothetical protein